MWVEKSYDKTRRLEGEGRRRNWAIKCNYNLWQSECCNLSQMEVAAAPGVNDHSEILLVKKTGSPAKNNVFFSGSKSKQPTHSFRFRSPDGFGMERGRLHDFLYCTLAAHKPLMISIYLDISAWLLLQLSYLWLQFQTTINHYSLHHWNIRL